jgi:small subunit ribosomal protein S2
VALLTRVVADAVADGLMSRSGARGGADAGEAAEVEPMPDWERELLGAGEEEAPAVEPAAAARIPADELPEVVADRGDDEPLPRATNRSESES